MHAARLERSARLQRVHELLSDRAEHSTREIARTADVCAVNSIVAELRDGGAEIECRPAKSPSGGRIFLYRMLRPASTTNGEEDEPSCEDCGCTDTLACEDELLGPCWWADRDDGRRLCSICGKKERWAQRGGRAQNPDVSDETNRHAEAGSSTMDAPSSVEGGCVSTAPPHDYRQLGLFG